jgi:hypothetical protein
VVHSGEDGLDAVGLTSLHDAFVVGGNFGWLWALAVLAIDPAARLVRAFYREYLEGPAFEMHHNSMPGAPPARFTLDTAPVWLTSSDEWLNDVLSLKRGDSVRTEHRTIRRVR